MPTIITPTVPADDRSRPVIRLSTPPAPTPPASSTDDRGRPTIQLR